MVEDLLTGERIQWRGATRYGPPRSGRAGGLHLARGQGGGGRAMSDESGWYRDAIIYQLHVRAFRDSDGDGIGDFAGPDREARLPARTSASRRSGCCRSIRRRSRTTATTSRTTPTSTRRTARCRTSGLSCARRTAATCKVITELVINHTSDQHPWFQRARRARPGIARARLLRLEHDRRPLHRRAHHLQGLRALELDLGPGGRRLLLAPLLLPPARPQLRQPDGPEGDLRRARLLARAGRRRAPARRRAVSLRARGHQLREPAGDARLPEGAAPAARREVSRTGCSSPRRTSGPKTRSPTSATATSATWRSTSR